MGAPNNDGQEDTSATIAAGTLIDKALQLYSGATTVFISAFFDVFDDPQTVLPPTTPPGCARVGSSPRLAAIAGDAVDVYGFIGVGRLAFGCAWPHN
ncbi:hypothetical protein HYH03_000498 [Edaphochlamys debaryana]|uniref:Uncharacterized protein n=1 Tax=Edaphochlamys debaryana TaxID=47281 RepID=A0A836C7Q1_9CHLO|nr:hypothetical protein HYH03_000498 [Edaphochlamys debaryana]|eukprot:KAG2502002.1 hypothetical protein HYH03_000498 [Edaphochlamys debaryana]